MTLVPTMLGIVSNSNEISIFSLAISIEGMIVTISSALNGLFLPKVTRLSLAGNHEKITELMIKVGRLQLYVWGLIFSGFCIFGPKFINLWVGTKFKNSYYIIIFIGLSSIFSLTQTVAMDFVYAKNEIKYTAKLTLITAIIGLVIAVPLARRYGAIGAGAGSGIGLIFYQILLNVFYKQKLKLEIGYFFKECHGKILPFIFIFSCLSGCFYYNLYLNNWFKLLLGIIIFSILFFVLMYCFVFNREEKNHLVIK